MRADRSMTTTRSGMRFEKYVSNLVTRLGYTNVKHSVTHSTRSTSCQIDVEYGMLWWKRYVECKYRSESSVGLDAVAKFDAVLDMVGASSYQGIVVTNANFTERSKEYAAMNGLELHNGTDLRDLDDATRQDERTLEQRIREVA